MTKSKRFMNEINDFSFGGIGLWWMGQMGFACNMGGTKVLIDPFLSFHAERLIEPLLNVDDINVNYIFGTHNHIDHIDIKAWKDIAKNNETVKFVVPDMVKDQIISETKVSCDRIVGLNVGVEKNFESFSVVPVAAAHEFLDMDENTGRYPYLSYVFKHNKYMFYHAGDTCIYPELVAILKKFSKLDAMIVPINGRDGKRYMSEIIGNMTFQEAVDLCGVVKPTFAIPGHYDMFASNGEDVKKFCAYMNAKYPLQQYKVCEHAELFHIYY